MASKRSTRTYRPADQEKAIGVHDRRDDAATKRRLLLTAAAVVVVLTGAFAGKRSLRDVLPMKHALTGPTFLHLLSICFCAMYHACHGDINLPASQSSTRHVYRLSREETRSDIVPAAAAFRVGGQIGGQALQGMHRLVLGACQFLPRQMSASYPAKPLLCGHDPCSLSLPHMADIIISASMQRHQSLMPAAGETHWQLPTCSRSCTLLPACSFPSTSLGSEQLLDSHAEASDTDAFPSSSSHTSAADQQAKSAPANKAKSLSQNSIQGDAAHLTQRPHDSSSHALPDAAASAASNLTDAAASAASKAADSNTNWASAFKDQLTAASDKITSGFQSATGSSTLSVASGKVASGLQLAASNVTATLASKASGVTAKAKTTAQGQSTQDIHSTAKEQLTAKQQSKPKGQNTIKSPASKKGSAGPVVFPWDVKMAKQTVCNDTCHKAVSAFQSCLWVTTLHPGCECELLSSLSSHCG